MLAGPAPLKAILTFIRRRSNVIDVIIDVKSTLCAYMVLVYFLEGLFSKNTSVVGLFSFVFPLHIFSWFLGISRNLQVHRRMLDKMLNLLTARKIIHFGGQSVTQRFPLGIQATQ